MRLSSLFIAMGIGAALGTAWLRFSQDPEPATTLPTINASFSSNTIPAPSPQLEPVETPIASEERVDPEAQDAAALPSAVLIDAPFMVQAPFGKWTEPYKEACEEATLAIIHAALEGKHALTPEEASQRILVFVDHQKKTSGDYRDTNAEQTAQLAAEVYNEIYELVEDPTVETIKQKLAQGHLLAAPMAGRELGNPNFTPPGPLYHMLVIRGYDDATEEFITNDPGTRRGEEYRYSYHTLLNALHDFPGSKEQILSGRKVILVAPKHFSQ